MDPQRHLNRSRVAVTLREQLVELMDTDLASDTRSYLATRPHLVSDQAVAMLDDWRQRAIDRDDSKTADWVLWYRNLLEAIWPLCLCAPLATAPNLKLHPVLAQGLSELSVHSVRDLSRITGSPALRQRLTALALQHAGDVEWAVVVLVAASGTGDHRQAWIEEHHALISYDAELRLNVYRDWARTTNQERLQRLLDEAYLLVGQIRQDVQAGRRRLHNMPLWRLAQQFVTARSWEESLGILRDHRQLLSDEGVEEMMSCLQASYVSDLLQRGDPGPFARYALHTELLEKARSEGVDGAYDALPLMPGALWLVAGLCRAVEPGIYSWDEYKRCGVERLHLLHLLAQLMRLAGFGDETPSDVASNLQTPVSRGEIATFTRLVLMQFVCRASASNALRLALDGGSTLLDPAMADLVADLHRADDGAVDAPGRAQLALFHSPYVHEILTLLVQTPLPGLDNLVPTGADLLLLLGGILQLAACETAHERAVCVGSSPLLEGPGAAALIAHLMSCGPVDLAPRLRRCLPVVERAARLGALSAAAAGCSEDTDGPDAFRAIMAWGMVPDRQALEALVAECPVLLSEQVEPDIRSIIETVRTTGDAEALQHARARHAWLLEIRRTRKENQAQLDGTVGYRAKADPMLRLIRELEIAIPVGLWVPVSRIDLTASFFSTLEDWIRLLESHLGDGSAGPLRRVSERTMGWCARFGPLESEHTPALSHFLHGLVLADGDEALREVVSRDVAFAEAPAADGILQDWLIVAEDLRKRDMAARLQDRIALLDAIRRSSVEIALLARAGEVSPESMALLSQALGVGQTDDIVALVEAARAAPLHQILEAGRRTEELLRQRDHPEVGALTKELRIRALILQLQEACASNPQEYVRMLMSEPLLADPEAAAAIRPSLAPLPPEVREATEWLLRFQADPTLCSLLRGGLSPVQEAEIKQLDAVLATVVLAPTWRQRFALIAEHDALRTERAALWAEWRGRVMEGQARGDVDYADAAKAFAQLWLEVGCFLRRALEVGQDVAAREKILTLAGKAPNTETQGLVRLISHLPASEAEELDATRDGYPEALERVLATANLDAEDQATVHFSLAVYYKTQHEECGERTDLDHAITHFRLTVAMSPTEGVDQAMRCRWLAASLLARFQHYGQDASDLSEAIEVLRTALQTPVVDRMRAEFLGELGRALSMRGEATNTVGEIREAIGILEEAIASSPRGSECWAGWHLNLGAAWSSLATMMKQPTGWVRAATVYEEALAADNLEPKLALSLRHNLANVRLYLGEATGSIGAIDTALDTFVRLDKEELPGEERASLYFGIGNGWLARDEILPDASSLDNAIASYRRALEFLDEDSPDAAMCRNNLAIALQRRARQDEGDDEEAMATYQAILSAPLDSSWPHLVVTAAQNYGNYCLRHGAFRQARTAYEMGLSALDRLRQAATTQEDRLRHAEEYAALYGRLVRCCLEMNDVPAALEHAQSSKARAFALQLAVRSGTAEAHDPLLTTLEREAGDLQARLAHLRRTLESSGDRHSVGAMRVREEIRPLQEREANLLQRIADLRRYERVGTAERVSVAGLETIQTELSQVGAIALEYYRDVAGWGVFVVSPQKVEHVRLAPHDPPWQAWIGGMFTPDYTPRDAEAVLGVLRELDSFFVAPLRAHLPARGTPLVLAPTELMSVLPLTAALAPDGHHLLDHHPITTVPSSYLYRHRPVRTFTSVLAASHPGLAGTRSYIPFSRVEADVIGTRFTKTRGLHGSELTCETLAGLAGRHDIVHLACHGFLDWQHPESSGLVLPEGQWLTVLDLLHRTRFEGPSLVVLSACDVGLEMPRPGDEHVSLVRAFVLAGVPTVVASLWSVNDISTMLLMRRFYSQLTQATGSVAEALREAERWLRSAEEEEVLDILEAIEEQLRDSGQERLSLDVFRGRLAVMALKRECPFAHPYYWAGFQAYGSAI